MAENKIEIIKVNGIVDNHTARRIFPVVKDPGMRDPDDIVSYAWKQKVKKVGEGPDDYIVYEEAEEVSRVNRKQYIQANASDVGVLNILEKVRRSGDVTLLNQTGASIPDEVQDYTNVPSNVGDALKAVQSGSNSFEGLKAIFGDTSFDALASMSSEEIAAKLQAYVASNTEKKGEAE